MTANNLLWSVLAPSQWILLCALLTVVCWRRPLGRWLGLATGSLVILLGLAPVGALLLEPLESRFAPPRADADVTGVIVLAGAEHASSTQLHSEPQLGSAGDRLTTFLLLAERHPRARLVHTGGADDSKIARSLILGSGIAPDRVSFEDQSVNTCDSARATRALVEPGDDERWLLVTSASHIPRAMACFRAIGWEVTPYPTDFRGGTYLPSLGLAENLEDVDIAAHEWLGLVYYRLRGYTKELFPGPSPL